MTLLQVLLMLVAGFLQRQQAAMIDHLKAENRMLRARLGGRRLICSDAERRQFAEKARALGRKAPHKPWHYRHAGDIASLVARKWAMPS
jgi:hypothetical protein